MTNFLVSKLQDDILDERTQFGSLSSDWRWASRGQVRGHLVQSIPQRGMQEELRLKVLQIQGKLQQIHVGLWDFVMVMEMGLEVCAIRARDEEEEEGEEESCRGGGNDEVGGCHG